jgi:glutamine amidotransferase
MCILLASSSAKPVSIQPYLAELARCGGLLDKHKDGWGMAIYCDRDLQLWRETQAAYQSCCLPLLQSQRYKLLLSHIRLATQGVIHLANTQPFVRELAGRMHSFIHNGDLTQIQQHPLGKRFIPIGNSDSEHAFCLLLNRLEPVWHKKPSLKQRHQIIQNFAQQMAQLGPANFVYSDSHVMFVFSDKRSQKNRTGYHSPGVHYLQKQQGKHNHCLFCSIPLSQEAWQPLPAGTLLAVKNGKIKAL